MHRGLGYDITVLDYLELGCRMAKKSSSSWTFLRLCLMEICSKPPTACRASISFSRSG